MPLVVLLGRLSGGVFFLVLYVGMLGRLYSNCHHSHRAGVLACLIDPP